jgi:uncharacterized protein YjaG (DUF416 family)
MTRGDQAPISRYKRALRRRLDQLDPAGRAAFAAACAERLLPAYRRFHEQTGRGEPQALAVALATLWRQLAGQEVPAAELERQARRAVALLDEPAEGEWSELSPYAEDAVAAVAYALQCYLQGESQQAFWAAYCVYRTLDTFIDDRDHLDPNAPGVAERIAADPLIQAELARQAEDLADLAATRDQPAERAALLPQLRDRAVRHGARLFG